MNAAETQTQPLQANLMSSVAAARMPPNQPRVLRDAGDFDAGDHVCCVYRNDEEREALVSQFLRRALDRNDKCLYLVDATTGHRIRHALTKAGVDVPRVEESGQLVLQTAVDTYLRHGKFLPHAMISLLAKAEEQALAEGFRALCVTGEMSWFLGRLTDPHLLVQYETELNHFFPGSHSYAVCQYDERRFEPDLLVRVVASHPILVIGTEPYENYYYVPPEKQLAPDRRVLYEHLLGQLRDRRRLDRELERRTADLESFSYSVSHDLRTPLHTMRGFLQLLDQESNRLSNDGREALSFVHAAATRMRQTVENLLGLAMVNQARVQRQEVNVSEIAERILRRMQSLEPARKVRTSIEAGVKVAADAQLVEIAFDNLLSNAWKFTRQEPTARIEVGVTERSGRKVIFVRDNGVGFDLSDAKRIFEPFQRFHDVEDFEGHGIGLATVQRIVARHGGVLAVDASPGKGATFFLSFDMDPHLNNNGPLSSRS